MRKKLVEPERATSGVNEELDILLRVLGIQQKQLADNSVSHKVINTTTQKDNPFPEQKPHSVALGASHGSRRRLRRRIKKDRMFSCLGLGGESGFWGLERHRFNSWDS